MTITCFAAAAFFLGYPVWQWLFGYQQEMATLPLLAIGGFFLVGGVAAVWRLAKGKPLCLKSVSWAGSVPKRGSVGLTLCAK